jgi:hypothetical protein
MVCNLTGNKIRYRHRQRRQAKGLPSLPFSLMIQAKDMPRESKKKESN